MGCRTEIWRWAACADNGANVTKTFACIPHPIRPPATFPSTLEKAINTAVDSFTRTNAGMRRSINCALDRDGARIDARMIVRRQIERRPRNFGE